MILNNMPNYSGPFKVGCRDIEYIKGDYPLYEEFGNNSIESKCNSPLLLRLYFPIEQDTTSNTLGEWATYPKDRYLRGLLDLIKTPQIFSKPFIHLLGGSPKIGAYTNDGSDLLNTEWQFPIAVFSHGLCGTRTFYSGICGELASYGIVVAAIEHRDHSAIFSYTILEPSEMEYKHPPREKAEEFKFRKKQLNFRVEEVKRTWDFLKELNFGTLESEYIMTPHSLDPEHYNIYKGGKWFSGLKAFKGRLDLKGAFMVGHSFGGATTLEVLSDESTPFKAGVTLDPWMLAVTCQQVHRPTIAIFTNYFHRWTENLELSKTLLRNSMKAKLDEDPSFENMVVLQPYTTHGHQSDFPALIEGKITSIIALLLNIKISPEDALKDNALACLYFLNRHISNDIKGHLKMDQCLEILKNGAFIMENL